MGVEDGHWDDYTIVREAGQEVGRHACIQGNRETGLKGARRCGNKDWIGEQENEGSTGLAIFEVFEEALDVDDVAAVEAFPDGGLRLGDLHGKGDAVAINGLDLAVGANLVAKFGRGAMTDIYMYADG